MVNLESSGFEYAYQFPSVGLKSRIRNGLSKFSDFFSEFSKYIVPAYHHDRCERSVQMRLYKMHKRELVLVFAAFLAAYGLGLFIGVAGPPITYTKEVDGSTLLIKNNKSQAGRADIFSGPFVMRTPTLNTYCQQLWILAKLTTSNNDDEIYVKSFQVSVSIAGISEEHKPVHVNSMKSVRNRTRYLQCERQNCDDFMILHLGFLDYAHYIISVKFFDLYEFHQRYIINKVTFYYKFYNPAFTQIEVWFRFIFLLSTFAIMCWFTSTLRHYDVSDWSIEQKWISVLLPLLLCHNNPTFPLTFLFNSWIPGMLDAVFQETFITAVLLFWLCIYHGLRQNDRRLLTFYFPKLLIVGMLWIAMMTLTKWQKYTELWDPTFNHTADAPNYYGLKIFSYLICGIYFLYLCILVVKAYSDLRFMPFFSMRLKFLTVMMLVVILITTITTLCHYGIDIIEDDFASQLSIKYDSSIQFMSFYGLLNFYVYAMAYVYSPEKKPSIYDMEVTKDNPTFSMINESDEDVVYGSDAESRRPLNSNTNDDSD